MFRLQLRIYPPDHHPPREVFLERFPSSLGRSLDNDLPLPFLSVSSRHLEIGLTSDGEPYLLDLGSTNGSFLGQNRLRPGEPLLLSNPTEFRLGSLRLEAIPHFPSSESSIRQEKPPSAEEKEDSPSFTSLHSDSSLHALVQHLVDDERRDDRNPPYLEVLTGPYKGATLELPLLSTVALGFGANFDLDLSNYGDPPKGNAPPITGLVGRMIAQGDSFCLHPECADLRSDGRSLDTPLLLTNGSILSLFDLRFRYIDPLEEALRALSFPRGTPDISTEEITPDKTPKSISGPPHEEITADLLPKEKRESLAEKRKPPRPQRRFGVVEIGLLTAGVFLIAGTISMLLLLFF